MLFVILNYGLSLGQLISPTSLLFSSNLEDALLIIGLAMLSSYISIKGQSVELVHDGYQEVNVLRNQEKKTISMSSVKRMISFA